MAKEYPDTSRRDFVKTAGIGLSGVLAGCIESEEETERDIGEWIAIDEGCNIYYRPMKLSRNVVQSEDQEIIGNFRIWNNSSSEQDLEANMYHVNSNGRGVDLTDKSTVSPGQRINYESGDLNIGQDTIIYAQIITYGEPCGENAVVTGSSFNVLSGDEEEGSGEGFQFVKDRLAR